MSDFVTLVEQETIATIEGLTGQTPSITFKEEEDISIVSSVTAPVAVVYINASGDASGRVAAVMPPQLGTALADLMLGGEGEQRDTMEEDDLDATKEIASNIFGAVSTALTAQKELPNINFAVDNINFFQGDDEVNLEGFTKLYVFDFQLEGIDSMLMFAIDDPISQSFEGGDDAGAIDMGGVPGAAGMAAPTGGGMAPPPGVDLNDTEMKNIGLIMDVGMTVKVRIGQKRMLLKDVISMDIGSVVELNQLANDPLEILVDDRVIAKGEVVIVDGNFGIQITEIGTQKEILGQLNG